MPLLGIVLMVRSRCHIRLPSRRYTPIIARAGLVGVLVLAGSRLAGTAISGCPSPSKSATVGGPTVKDNWLGI